MNIRKRIILIAIILISSIFFVLGLRHKYQQISNDFISHTNQIVQNITQEMKVTASFLDSLSNSNEVQDLILDQNSPNKKKRLQELFAATITRSPSYDQLRYIDETGYEVVRVNYRNSRLTVVPENLHQQKNNRYYFTDTMKLKKGEVYLSPLDLNIENGKIETPYIPTIRMSVPIFDKNGQRKGIIIVNYRASDILNRLAAPEKLTKYVNTYLVNSEGFLIKGPTPDSEWGFMLAGKQDEKFKKYFPLTDSIIENKDDGDLINKEGVFFWVKFYPIEEIKPKDANINPHLFYYSRYLATKDFHLTIVAHSNVSQIIQYLRDFN